MSNFFCGFIQDPLDVKETLALLVFKAHLELLEMMAEQVEEDVRETKDRLVTVEHKDQG